MSISIAEAKAHLSDCIRQAEQGEPILNTRHGKPVAALVAASHLEHSSDFGGPGLRADWPVWLGDGMDRKNWFSTIEQMPRTQARLAKPLD